MNAYGASGQWETARQDSKDGASRDRAYEATERLVEIRQGSYEIFIDYASALQERNGRFAQGMIYALARKYRQQAEANRAIASPTERLPRKRRALCEFSVSVLRV